MLRTEGVANEIIPYLPHRAGEFPALRQGRVKRVDEHVDFAFADDQRREDFDHIHRVAGDLRQDAMLA